MPQAEKIPDYNKLDKLHTAPAHRTAPAHSTCTPQETPQPDTATAVQFFWVKPTAVIQRCGNTAGHWQYPPVCFSCTRLAPRLVMLLLRGVQLQLNKRRGRTTTFSKKRNGATAQISVHWMVRLKIIILAALYSFYVGLPLKIHPPSSRYNLLFDNQTPG